MGPFWSWRFYCHPLGIAPLSNDRVQCRWGWVMDCPAVVRLGLGLGELGLQPIGPVPLEPEFGELVLGDRAANAAAAPQCNEAGM